MAQRFRTDLKDEIAQGGMKFWRAVNASGTILLDKFKMERTNTNTQDGSAFGAKEANAIHAFLNGVIDGTETVDSATDATNASRLPNLGYGAAMPLSSDALGISLDRSKNGLIEQVNSYSAATKNLPVANFIGTKIQYVIEGSWAIVVLYEMYPISGRIWMNTYNQTWRGWVPFSSDDAVIDKTKSYFNTYGLALGSQSNPNRPLNLYSSDGTFYQLHSNGGDFWIHRFNSSNQVINSPLSIIKGVSTVDIAGSVMGYKIYTTFHIVNPGGGNSIDVPIPSGAFKCGLAVNGNIDSNDAFVIGCKGAGNVLRVRLNKATSLPIQLNVTTIYA